MIPYKVFDAFKFGPLTLHTWGIFFALGFVAALIYVMSEAIRKKISSDKIFDLSLILLFAGVLGSRLGFVIANYQIYLSYPVEIFKVWDGGLGFISGFLLAILVGWLYIRAQKLDFWKVADIYAPAVALGYFIGRIGCFLTHDHLGKETNFFLGVKMAEKVYHDTSIYTTALALIIFIILLLLKNRERFDGSLFYIFVLLYTLGRFKIEFFQVGPYFYGLTATAWVVATTFIVTLAFYLKRTKWKFWSLK